MKLASFLASAFFLAAPLAQATPVDFVFGGHCAQNCGAASLIDGQAVSGSLQIDSSFLPTVEGDRTMVSNANLLGLSFAYGAEHFSFGDIVSADSTEFMLLGGRLIVRNGAGLLAHNGSYGLLVSGPGGGRVPPTMGMWLQEPSTLSWGKFMASVPEPASGGLLLLGLAALVARSVIPPRNS
jgi:hypothetical protein